MHSPHILQSFVQVLEPKKSNYFSKTSRYSLLIPIPVTFFYCYSTKHPRTHTYTQAKMINDQTVKQQQQSNSAGLFVLQCCPLHISAPDFNCKWRSTRDPIFVFCYYIWWFFLFCLCGGRFFPAAPMYGRLGDLDDQFFQSCCMGANRVCNVG